MKSDNELIAEFMGLILWKIIDGQRYYRVPKEHVYSQNAALGQFRYDTSWDWLMPVVEKIESIGFRTSMVLNSSDDKHGHHILIKDRSHTIINHASDPNKIIATYKAVVEFIKWYNAEKYKP